MELPNIWLKGVLFQNGTRKHILVIYFDKVQCPTKRPGKFLKRVGMWTSKYKLREL